MAPSDVFASDEITSDDGEAMVSIVARLNSSGTERVLASTTLERDPTRQTRTVRSSNLASRAGRRVRLRIVADDSPHLEWSVNPKNVNVSPDENSEKKSLRFSAGTLVLESPLIPPFPMTCHAGDPPVERVVGSLKRNGVVAQLRFAPVGEPKTLDENEQRPTLATSFRLLDGAITFNEDSVLGRVASQKAGAVSVPLPRDVLATRTPAPRAGRSPDVWDPVGPEDAEDAESVAMRKQRQLEMMQDTPSWKGTEAACAPLMARREERLRDLAAVDIRRDCVLEMARRLRQERFDAWEAADKAEAFRLLNAAELREKASKPSVVTELLLNSVREGLQITKAPRSAVVHRAPKPAEEIKKIQELETINAEKALEDLDDLEGFDVDDLINETGECKMRHDALVQVVKALEIDIGDRGRWDTFESGVETRDVLENGVRRADMELFLGRPAMKLDIDASLVIPPAERMRIVAGVDVPKARITGRPEYVKKLPGAGGGSSFRFDSLK